MNHVIARLRATAPGVLAVEPVTVACLFGSHARGEANQLSDVDVALLVPDVPPPDRLNLLLRVGARLESAARVGELDVVVLDGSPLTLTGRVVRDGIAIYGTDDPLRLEYESRTFREFVDFSLLGGPARPRDVADDSRGQTLMADPRRVRHLLEVIEEQTRLLRGLETTASERLLADRDPQDPAR